MERRGLGKDINSKKSGKCIRLPRGIHNSSGTVINSSDPLVNTDAWEGKNEVPAPALGLWVWLDGLEKSRGDFVHAGWLDWCKICCDVLVWRMRRCSSIQTSITKIKDMVIWWAFMNCDLRWSSSCICSTARQCTSNPGKHTFTDLSNNFCNFKIEQLKGSSSCLLQLWVSAVMLCLLDVDCVYFFSF